MVLGNWNDKNNRQPSSQSSNGIPAGAESDSDYYLDFESEDEFDDVSSGHRVHTTTIPSHPYKELRTGVPAGLRVWRLRHQHHIFKIMASADFLMSLAYRPIECPIRHSNPAILTVREKKTKCYFKWEK